MIKKLFLLLIPVTILFSCKKADVKNYNYKLAVGQSAKDILSASNYQSVKLEITYMPGYAPDAGAISNLTDYLNMLINKPGGIQITQRQISASGKGSLTLEEIRTIEDANRTVFTTGNTLGVYAMYVDADYSKVNTIGVAYRNTSLVVFGKTVVASSGGINQVTRTKLETVGLEHEFGHLLGLVNLGSPMQMDHEDAAHEKHCNNSKCLMYYATQITMMGGIILNAPVPLLDDNCRNDLHANGGK